MQDGAGVDRRARRREGKLAQIVAEAWDLARRDSLTGISLRDLADRVGLRQPSLYAYFDSKLELYDAMFADAYRQLLERCTTRVPPDDPEEDLAEVVRLLVQFSAEDVERHQLLFQRTIPGFEPSAASMALAEEFSTSVADRLTAAGLRSRDDLDLFSALVSGLAHQQVANDPGGDRWVRLAAPAVALLLARADRPPATSATPPAPRSRTTTTGTRRGLRKEAS